MAVRRGFRALIVFTIASLLMATAVFADNTGVDGDSTQAGNQTTVALGDVCAEGTGSATIPIWANRNGNYPGPQVWLNGATITYSVFGTPTPGLSASFPDGNQGVLPSNWGAPSTPNNARGAEKSVKVDFAAGTVTGPFSGTITLRGSGAGSNGPTVNRDVTLTVTANVLTCNPPNTPPVADAGGPYTGAEGANVNISGANSSDADNDPLTYKWTYSVDSADAGTTCAFANDTAAVTTVTCTDDGAFTLTLEVSDGTDTDSDTASLTLTNAPPGFASGSPAFGATSVTCADRTVTVNFAFTDAGSNDTHTGTIDFGDGSGSRALTATELANGSASHAYNSGGPYSATVTITDDNGGSTGATSTTNTLTVQYNLSDILQPINNTRLGNQPSLFKYGSTIPVKVVVTDCDGAVPSDLTLKVTWRQGLNATPAGVDEVIPTSQADLGNTMRFSDDKYVLQLNSRNTTADSTSGITIWVTIQETGQNVSANIGFKK